MAVTSFVKPERQSLFEEHQRLNQDHDLRTHIVNTFFEAAMNGDDDAIFRLLDEQTPGVPPKG